MTTRPLAVDDYDAISRIMCDGGLECSPQYIQRNLPRGVTLVDGNEVIGFCGLIPVKIWRGQTEADAFQLGMLGMKAGQGPALSDLLDGVRAVVGDKFVYANTANKKGAKVWTRFYGMKAGPVENSVIRYRPLVPFVGFARADHPVDDARWNTFIDELRAHNNGLMTARSVAGWQRLNAACLTVTDANRILGAVFVRKRLFSPLRLRRFDIVDICAINNDELVLKQLLKKAARWASRCGGLILEYVGSPTGRNVLFDQMLPHHRPAVSNSFVYDGELDLDKGWFFGPYDGDRCIS